jgi:glycosyltransferase involved in cell wall biosynthesis
MEASEGGRSSLIRDEMTPPDISVIIPVRDGGSNFRRCLQGISMAAPPSTEIIVVADGDTDGSWRVAEEFGMRVLRISKPQGPARARNFGAQAAQGDILLFLDADVVIHPDAIRQIEAAFSNDPQLTALFGSYDDEPGQNNFLSQYKNLFHHYVHQISQEDASTFWSGCGAIRRKIFLELGGFNESYRKPCIEDIELGYRLRQAGYLIRLSKKLQVKHLKRWDIVSLLKSDFYDRGLPWTELILRDRRFINDLNLRISSRLSVMLTYVLLFALIGGGWGPKFFAVAGVSALSLILINSPLYLFFSRKRGLWFMIKTIPWHWFYYFYSGLAFGIGLGRFFFSRHKSSQVNVRAAPKELSDTPQYLEWR